MVVPPALGRGRGSPDETQNLRRSQRDPASDPGPSAVCLGWVRTPSSARDPTPTRPRGADDEGTPKEVPGTSQWARLTEDGQRGTRPPS